MVDKASDQHAPLYDKLKTAAAILSLIAGVVLFYQLDEELVFYRVVAIVGMTIVAVVFFFMTDSGRDTAGFLSGSRVELQKMVWPTRKETVYSTLVVFVAIFIVAMFLWVVDLFLAWFMQLVIK